ncbi:hypothetical protein GOP47_0010546 [Adiantum capillus-veneris]|uniref:Uncharacterized protein n=1 Tax=Adiantum capillus-veneris TaxID=13818 RepID=A0A9D4UVH0_ADICA|nr:hypothetical protein GOP47_0010546 [Adiantum capillus-veneris]
MRVLNVLFHNEKGQELRKRSGQHLSLEMLLLSDVHVLLSTQCLFEILVLPLELKDGRILEIKPFIYREPCFNFAKSKLTYFGKFVHESLVFFMNTRFFFSLLFSLGIATHDNVDTSLLLSVSIGLPMEASCSHDLMKSACSCAAMSTDETFLLGINMCFVNTEESHASVLCNLPTCVEKYTCNN